MTKTRIVVEEDRYGRETVFREVIPEPSFPMVGPARGEYEERIASERALVQYIPPEQNRTSRWS